MDQFQSGTSMEHAQGEWSLHACDLVVVKFHNVIGSATVIVVYRIWSEYAGEQNPRPGTQWVCFLHLQAGWIGYVADFHWLEPKNFAVFLNKGEHCFLIESDIAVSDHLHIKLNDFFEIFNTYY